MIDMSGSMPLPISLRRSRTTRCIASHSAPRAGSTAAFRISLHDELASSARSARLWPLE